MPIIVVFYRENGLSMTQILLLPTIFSVTALILEIPTGYFADAMGRKKSIIIGTLLGVVGFATYSFTSGFFYFALAEFFLGASSSFISGTDSAMLYDSLVQMKKKDKYKKYQGIVSSASNFSEAIAAIIGGVIAIISLRFTFYAETIIFLLSVPVAFSLVEPRRKLASSKQNVLNIIEAVKFSLHEHKETKWLIIFAAIIGTATYNMVWFIQPYMQNVGVPLVLFGIIWAIFQFSVGFFALSSHKIESFFGRKRSLILLLVLPVIGYFIVGLGNAIWAVPFILLFYFARGINSPILGDYVNNVIPSDKRATILSVKNLMWRLVFAVVGPIVGWVADAYSMNAALVASGFIILIPGIISLLYLHKYKAL